MICRFKNWKDAYLAALALANQLGHDVGIWKQIEYGQEGYNIRSLPKPENRYGHELRCEVVQPYK